MLGVSRLMMAVICASRCLVYAVMFLLVIGTLSVESASTVDRPDQLTDKLEEQQVLCLIIYNYASFTHCCLS